MFKKGKYYYYDFVLNGKRHQGSTGEPNIKEAKTFVRDMKRSILFKKPSEENIPDDRMKLEDSIQKMWVQQWSVNRDGKRSKRQLTDIVEILTDKCRKIYVDEITDDDFATIRDVLLDRPKINKGTVNRYTAAFKTMMKKARDEWRVIERIPVMKKLKAPVQERRCMDDYEEEKMLQMYHDERCVLLGKRQYRNVFIILVDTGVRCAELSRLELRDFNPRVKEITIRSNGNGETKAQNTRVIPLTDRAWKCLEDQAKFMRIFNPGDRLFKVEPTPLSRRVSLHFKKCEIPDLTAHCLRHTFGTRLLEKGVPTVTVQYLMGHETVITTEKYLKVTKIATREAIRTKRLEVALKGD